MAATPIDLIFRPAAPDDAERVIAHAVAMTHEAAEWLPMEPDEFPLTPEQERQFLGEVAASDNSLFLLAEAGGAAGTSEMVGLLHYVGGKRRATRHAAVLGITVRKAWQGRGIGRGLMLDGIRRAKSTGVLRRLELGVYADNHRAIALYESVGFVTEGVKRNAVVRGGKFVDEHVMGLVW